ncbi:MAG: NUDIX domain-containing protein [Bacteroidia bacterium]
MTAYTYCPRCATALVSGLRGDRGRLSCPACDWVHWDNPVPVVAAIVERQGTVVLVRSQGWPEDWFGVVTGFLEKAESPAEAVLREVREELGLEARLGGFIGLYPFERMNQLIIAYHVEAHEGEIRLDETELAACRQVPIDRVRPWPTGTGYALADWLRSRGLTPEFLSFGKRS